MVHEYLFEAATSFVTAKMVREIGEGEEILLNDKFSLYGYTTSDSVVIVDHDDWIEYADCLVDGDNVIFEMAI